MTRSSLAILGVRPARVSVTQRHDNEDSTGNAVPASEPRDAFHTAISAVNGIQYLLTWNFKYIANASLRDRIKGICRDAAFEPPIICTPEELMGADDGS